MYKTSHLNNEFSTLTILATGETIIYATAYLQNLLIFLKLN